MNFMAEDVCHDEFLHKSRLEQVLESMLGGNLLRFANKTYDLVDVIHCGGKSYLFHLGLSSW